MDRLAAVVYESRSLERQIVKQVIMMRGGGCGEGAGSVDTPVGPKAPWLPRLELPPVGDRIGEGSPLLGQGAAAACRLAAVHSPLLAAPCRV